MTPIVDTELSARVKSCLSLYSANNSSDTSQPVLLAGDRQPCKTGVNEVEKKYHSDVELVQKTCQFLLNDLSLNHLFEELAHKMGTNHNKLAQAAKNVLGVGMHHWLVAERMKEAGRLCATTDLSIQEIGYRVGYSNPDSFSTAFKAYFRRPPKRYRENEKI